MAAELVPVTTPEDIADLPLEQRGQLITRALEESKGWLAVATRGTDPTPLAEFRAWAATVAEMTRQRGLAEDIQMDALEMVRRAERGIGISIRNGQKAGHIRRRHEHEGNQHTRGGGRISDSSKPTPTDFATKHELSSNGTGIYALTDGITDEEFDDALSEARAERNLTRANVIRKAQRQVDLRRWLPLPERLQQIRRLAASNASSKQIASEIGISAERVRDLARENDIAIPADKAVARVNTNVDPAKVIRSTVEELAGSLEVTWSLLRPHDFDRLDPGEMREWINSLDHSLQSLRKLKKELTLRAR